MKSYFLLMESNMNIRVLQSFEPNMLLLCPVLRAFILINLYVCKLVSSCNGSSYILCVGEMSIKRLTNQQRILYLYTLLIELEKSQWNYTFLVCFKNTFHWKHDKSIMNLYYNMIVITNNIYYQHDYSMIQQTCSWQCYQLIKWTKSL